MEISGKISYPDNCLFVLGSRYCYLECIPKPDYIADTSQDNNYQFPHRKKSIPVLCGSRQHPCCLEIDNYCLETRAQGEFWDAILITRNM